MDRIHIQANVVKILKARVGKANAITAAQLYAEATDGWIIPAKKYDQTRLLRSIIPELRRQHRMPIVSGNTGYWWAASVDEYIAYRDTELTAASKIFNIKLKAHNAIIAAMREQQTINFNTSTNVNNEELQHG